MAIDWSDAVKMLQDHVALATSKKQRLEAWDAHREKVVLPTLQEAAKALRAAGVEAHGRTTAGGGFVVDTKPIYSAVLTVGSAFESLQIVRVPAERRGYESVEGDLELEYQPQLDGSVQVFMTGRDGKTTRGERIEDVRTIHEVAIHDHVLQLLGRPRG